MFSKRQFAENKIVRYTAYTIVIGFALMMFLPTTISLPELFRAGGNDFITVNDREIFNKSIPFAKDKPQLQASFAYILEQDYAKGDNKDKSSKGTDAFWLNYMLNNWNSPSSISYRNMGSYRTQLRNIVQWEMNYDLARELGYDLSNEKLNDFIKHSYRLYLRELYKEYLDEYAKRKKETRLSFKDFRIENSDYYWEAYYKWASTYLKEYYLVNMIMNPIQNGTLVPLADIDKEIEIEKHEVQVDFALYTYSAFIKSDFYRGLVNEADLRESYEKNKLRITVEELGFDKEEDAQKALETKELFKKKPKASKSSSDNKTKRKIITKDDDLYEKLRSYKADEISEVMKGEEDKFYIYKIITKAKSFDEMKNDEKEYSKFLEDYGKDSYDKLKEDYKKYASKIMAEYLSEVRALNEGLNILAKQDGRFKDIRAGRTELFSQNSRRINEIENEEAGEGDKEKKSIKPVEEFISIGRGRDVKSVYNEAFFKEAYSLSVNELSKEPISYNMQANLKEEDVFFVLQKIEEKKPKSEDLVEDKKNAIRKIKLSDQYIIMNNWIDYLEKTRDYEVEINNRNIIAYLGFDFVPTDTK